MSEPVFLIALAIAGTTLVLVAGAIAGAIRGRGSSRSIELNDQLKDQATALEDLQNTVASQSNPLAELNERLDFAERLLAQSRDRTVLKSDN